MASFEIAGRAVGPDKPCLIVAEVGQTHDGSLGTAHAFIDAVAQAGADAIKFQTHIAAAESTPSEPWRVQFSQQDPSRYEYWQRMEFTEEAWEGLERHAKERDIIFLSSPFSLQAVELLVRVGMPAWKIASGEVTNVPLFERIAETGLPILLSSGMNPLEEIDANVNQAQTRGQPIAVLQCTTAYPCPPEKVGLNLIPYFRERYGCPIGLSDHTGTNLYRSRRRSARYRRPGSPRGVNTGDVRSGCAGFHHHGGAPAADRRNPLHRTDTRQPGGQGRHGPGYGTAT